MTGPGPLVVLGGLATFEEPPPPSKAERVARRAYDRAASDVEAHRQACGRLYDTWYLVDLERRLARRSRFDDLAGMTEAEDRWKMLIARADAAHRRLRRAR